jgi:hypothetical protein
VNRSPDSAGIAAAGVTAGALIAQQVIGKAVRDALFLTTFTAADLPAMMIVGALLSLVSAASLSRLLQRYAPRRILPLLFGASAVAFVGEWVLGFYQPAWMTVAFYIHMALLGPALLSAFWSLINEHYDPYNAKRAVARIAGGGTVGGVVGGLAVWRASDAISLQDLLLAMAAIHVACLVGTVLIRSTRAHVSQQVILPGAGTRRALGSLMRAPLLRNLAVIVAIGSATSSLLDYLLSSSAAHAFGKGAPLLGFFSLFWLSVAVVSMIVQFTLGERVIERLGLARNIGALPGMLIIGGVAALAVPSLAAFVLLRGFEAVQRNTLYRSAYELFYTPVSESKKRAAKALIDIGFDRLGTIAGAALVALFLVMGADRVPVFVLGAIIMLSIATLPVAQSLRAGYIAALEGGLRAGTETGTPVIQAAPPAEPANLGSGPISDALRDPAAVEAASAALRDLSARSVQPAVAHAIMLLAHRELSATAFDALSKISASFTGQLSDVLVDRGADMLVRRRVALVLARTGTQRGVDALLLGMTDESFEIRYVCSRALMQLSTRYPQLDIDRAKILHALLVELDHRSREPVRPAFVPDPLEEAPVFVVPGPIEVVDHTLDHVFTVVALHVGRDQLQMAYRALHNADLRQRGTALEYLQAILPSDFRDALWPFVGSAATEQPRSARTVLAELIRTTSAAPRRN